MSVLLWLRRLKNWVRAYFKRPTLPSLHEACYHGDLKTVKKRLSMGADPNGTDSNPRWISCAGRNTRPLNCVALAWAMSDDHVKIAELLLRFGALVDETILRDHTLEMVGSEADHALILLLKTHRRAIP
jgi:hypothetical protein